MKNSTALTGTASILFIVAFLGFSGLIDFSSLTSSSDENLIVQGEKIEKSRIPLLVQSAYALQEKYGAENLLSMAKPEEAKGDDWALFGEVIQDPSRASNLSHLTALIRLLKTVSDPRIQAILRKLVCSALPEICKNLEPLQHEKIVDVVDENLEVFRIDDLDLSVRAYNCIVAGYQFSSYPSKSKEDYSKVNFEEILKAFQYEGGGNTEQGLRRVRNMGNLTINDFKESLRGKAPNLYKKYFSGG